GTTARVSAVPRSRVGDASRQPFRGRIASGVAARRGACAPSAGAGRIRLTSLAYHTFELLQTLRHPYLIDLLERIRRRGPFSRREIAVFLVAFSAAYVFGIRWNHGMADFAVNYRAGQRIVAGETLYRTSDGHYMFKYFPSAALIYAPFTALPIELAMVVWFLLSLAAFIAIFRIVDRLIPDKHVPYLLAIAGAILAKYILHELRLGQINVFVTLLML